MILVGRGRCAELTAIDDAKVLKLYESRFSNDLVRTFAGRNVEVHRAGIRTPEVFGVEVDGDRTAIVLERIHGTTLWEAIRDRPDDAVVLGEQLAELHLDIHERTLSGLDDKLSEVAMRVQQRGESSEVTRALSIIDDGRDRPQMLLHGDLHPANVMVDEHGELISIDWDGAMIGPAAYDVARAYFLISSWALAPGTDELDADLRQTVADAYVARYSQGSRPDVGPIEPWFLPAVLARYAENVTEEYPMLDGQCEDAISALG